MQMYLSVVMARMWRTVEVEVNLMNISAATQILVSWIMLQLRNKGMEMAPVHRSDKARLVRM